jgi:hypothetical protein
MRFNDSMFCFGGILIFVSNKKVNMMSNPVNIKSYFSARLQKKHIKSSHCPVTTSLYFLLNCDNIV